MNTYRICLHGPVTVAELNPMSPHQMTLLQAEPSATLVSIYTDQSGLLGMLRHLHNLGFVLLSIDCTPNPVMEEIERKEP